MQTNQNLRLMLREHVRAMYEVMKMRVKLERRFRTLKQKALGYGAPRIQHAVNSAQSTEERLKGDITRALSSFVIWDWLKTVKGIGPVLAGLLVSETNIEECTTVSKMWAWWGLDPESKGSSYRRSRVSKVVGESLLRKRSKPYYAAYLRYKTTKEHTMVEPCMACNGSGKHGDDSCANCAGTGKGPWGKSQNHRHAAARRYMVKRFLADLWRVWRIREGLPCPEPYKVQ